jgi:hypothetical protein
MPPDSGRVGPTGAVIWRSSRLVSSLIRPRIKPRTEVTLVSIVLAYCGTSAASPATCIPMMPPTAPIAPRPIKTATSTERTCGTCMRRSTSTNGARTKESRIASVMGIRTSRAR